MTLDMISASSRTSEVGTAHQKHRTVRSSMGNSSKNNSIQYPVQHHQSSKTLLRMLSILIIDCKTLILGVFKIEQRAQPSFYQEHTSYLGRETSTENNRQTTSWMCDIKDQTVSSGFIITTSEASAVFNTLHGTSLCSMHQNT